MNSTIQGLRERIADLAINVARLEKLGCYVNSNGELIQPCPGDAERIAAELRTQIYETAVHVITSMTLPDAE